MYREPAKPQTTRKSIVLPRHRVPRVILGACLWFLSFWFLIWPVVWLVEALVTGEGLWRLAIAPFIWLAIVWGLVRVMRFDRVEIGPERLSRAGFLRDRSMAWSEVLGFEERKKYRSRGGPVRLYAVLSEAGELLVAPDILEDPERNLRWALERASKGELRDIEERVRSLGRERSAWRQPMTHVAIALVLSVGVGTLLWGDQRRRQVERTFRELDGEPYAVKVAAHEAILQDESLELRQRCRAGSLLITEATWQGEFERARTWCAAMGPIGCGTLPYAIDTVPCEGRPFAVLAEARAALAAGDAERAVGLVGSHRFQGAVRDAIEVQALRESGSPGMARVVAERCVERYGESEDPVIRGFAEECRGAL
ncbi:MAG: hypothetical protein JJ863_37135 [Deltaproteobacteria bacterium]|nr:hypothetical protein [Deltaproteobacteria bacterium]